MVRSLRLVRPSGVGEVCASIALDALRVRLISVVQAAWFKRRGGRGGKVFSKMVGDKVAESWFGWTKVDQS